MQAGQVTILTGLVPRSSFGSQRGLLALVSRAGPTGRAMVQIPGPVLRRCTDGGYYLAAILTGQAIRGCSNAVRGQDAAAALSARPVRAVLVFIVFSRRL